MIEHHTGGEQAAWEREYRIRGRKYGGAPRDLPSLAPGARVLEAGCGDGKALAAMASRSWSILAVNPLLGAVEYVLADAAALPFRDETFDAVFLTHSAGHAPEPARNILASESSRVLRSGGRLFFTGFSTADFRSGRGTAIDPSTRLNGDGILTHYFTRDEVILLFSLLVPVSVSEETWSMKIRGRTLQRAEIVGEFQRE
ncbi:MAG: class I SAM-dependent methyltransferase [Methanomicrobiales archaeon]|nr:class I SAM-dependent methyltransferase [Methanomicrobiales archaeon]